MTDPKGNQNWLHTDKAEKTITNCIPGNYKFEVQSLYRNNGSTNGQVAQLVFLEDEQLIFADTTGDGKVDITDATQIQRYLAYSIPSLG